MKSLRNLAAGSLILLVERFQFLSIVYFRKPKTHSTGSEDEDRPRLAVWGSINACFQLTIGKQVTF